MFVEIEKSKLWNKHEVKKHDVVSKTTSFTRSSSSSLEFHQNYKRSAVAKLQVCESKEK